jgi:Putative addiction module component
MKTKDDIIHDASNLDPEDRAIVIDTLLKTLNTPDPDIDQVWSEESQKRLQELRSGQTVSIPAEEVFSKIKEHF